MNFWENFKIVLTLILVENFFYKYYIGANFFTELHNKNIKKEKVAIDFFILLSFSSTFLYLLKKLYHIFLASDIGYLLLITLATYFSILIYERLFKVLEKKLYFSANIFLLLTLIENRFDNTVAKSIAIILIPLFYYFNLVLLEPLLKNLNYKKSSIYIKKDALIIIIISLIGLILSAFDTF